MQFFISNKPKLTATIALVLLMASVTLMAFPVQAQESEHGGSPVGGAGASVYPLPSGVTPDYKVTTYAYLSCRPNPIGVGQSLLVNIWITPSVHVSCYMTGYTVTITKPDGTVDTVGPLNSYYGDCTSWFEYTVDQPGTWTLKFNFPGGYFPPGVYIINPGAALYVGGGTVNMTQSRWYEPSSSPVTELTVQPEMVASWPPAPLPTDYWTRPVHVQNREWWPILGNYPWSGSGEGFPNWPADTNYFKGNTKYNAWVLAPNTAHIVWRRQDAISGIIGAEAGFLYSTQSGAGAVPRGNVPTLIFSGRCYDTMEIPIDGVPTSCAVCYDLRTGEMYYAIPGGTTPSIVTYAASYSTIAGMPAVPGGQAGAGFIVELLSISGNRLLKINPWNGEVTTNVTAMSGTVIGQFVISMQTNNTRTGPMLINWTTAGTSDNFTSRIVENRSVAFSSISSNCDWERGLFGTISTLSYNAAPYGLRIVGYDLKTGQMTCNVTDDFVPYQTATAAVDHGKIACLMQDGYAAAYDLRTGKRIWVSQQTYSVSGYPWGIWGAYDSASYGGNYIVDLYDGIYAFNWTTGKISWVYRDTPTVPFETPYAMANVTDGGVNPFDVGVSIADGKIFTYNSEHTPSQPFTRGWKLHCINATTGKGIWNITGPMAPGPMADGYLTASSEDGYMYVFGRGKSATTVSAPDVAVPLGTAFTIKGSVLDTSPAQPGTPCVSKDSMTTQMEYLHMQFPIGGIWGNATITGVPVILTAIGSDGTVIDVGTTMTDGYGGTFGMAWTPPKEDTYTIMATFAGDDSYGSSMATTAVTVGPAPASPTPTPTEQPQAAPDNTPMYFAISTILIILAIAIVGALVLRKRP